MKQTLKPKIVPMEKVGYGAGDVVKYIGHPCEHYTFGQLLIGGIDNPYSTMWQAQQVLLVDENAPIGVGDTYLDNADCIRVAVMDDPGYWSVRLDYHKIIASHPQLPGTLPISPETLRAIVECGGECTCDATKGQFVSGNYTNTCSNCHVQFWDADKRWLLCRECSSRYVLDPSGCIMVAVVRNEPTDKPKITFDTGRVAIRESVTVGCWTDVDMLGAWNAKEELYKHVDKPDFTEWLTSYKQSKQTT